MDAIGTEDAADLRAELEDIGRLVEEAAVDEDVVEFSRLVMRERALPRLIREARTAPLREQLARLEEEAEGLVAERDRALVEEPPPAPAMMRNTVTPAMMRAQILDGINRRESAVARERRG